MKYKVGDKVRIKHTDYTGEGLDVGTVHEVVEVSCFGVCLEGCISQALYFRYTEVEPAHIITVGNTYTSSNGGKWECIFVRDGIAWMTRHNSTAYTWDANTGKSVCLNDKYDIVFPERRNGSVEYVNGVPKFDTWMEEE